MQFARRAPAAARQPALPDNASYFEKAKAWIMDERMKYVAYHVSFFLVGTVMAKTNCLGILGAMDESLTKVNNLERAMMQNQGQPQM